MAVENILYDVTPNFLIIGAQYQILLLGCLKVWGNSM